MRVMDREHRFGYSEQGGCLVIEVMVQDMGENPWRAGELSEEIQNIVRNTTCELVVIDISRVKKTHIAFMFRFFSLLHIITEAGGRMLIRAPRSQEERAWFTISDNHREKLKLYDSPVYTALSTLEVFVFA